jgi:hypothetical protein
MVGHPQYSRKMRNEENSWVGRPQMHDGKCDADDRKELNYSRLNRLSVEPSGGIRRMYYMSL